jgi:hypothetical protein
MKNFRCSVLFILCLTLAAALAGCDLGNPQTLSSGAGGMDMFTPQKMRLHPLSRILPPAGKSPPVIEARLEFTDQFGDIGKAVGTVYFELFAYETFALNNQGDRLAIWNFDLNTPQSNKDRWDSITRTYLFKLPVPDDVLAKRSRVILKATFALPSGSRLTADMPLSLKQTGGSPPPPGRANRS